MDSLSASWILGNLRVRSNPPAWNEKRTHNFHCVQKISKRLHNICNYFHWKRPLRKEVHLMWNFTPPCKQILVYLIIKLVKRIKSKTCHCRLKPVKKYKKLKTFSSLKGVNTKQKHISSAYLTWGWVRVNVFKIHSPSVTFSGHLVKYDSFLDITVHFRKI